MKHFHLRKDRFLKMKGGTSKILMINCDRCGSYILTYQKDGIGGLKRCYLDRILDPSSLVGLHNNPRITSAKSVQQLTCLNCRGVIGVPMRHHSGRLAFHLLPGTFRKRAWRNETTESPTPPGIVDNAVAASGAFGA
jgi:hypothetical protein